MRTCVVPHEDGRLGRCIREVHGIVEKRINSRGDLEVIFDAVAYGLVGVGCVALCSILAGLFFKSNILCTFKLWWVGDQNFSPTS